MPLRALPYGVLMTCAIHGGVVAAGDGPLTLEKRIALPGVEGRLDHMVLAADGSTLALAALGHGTIEVIDVAEGKVVKSLTGLSEPQGVLFLPGDRTLVVTEGGSGRCLFYDTKTFTMTHRTDVGDDADNVRIEPATGHPWVAYGSGALACLDGATGAKLASIALQDHPESFQLEAKGSRIFANVPGASHVAVVDRQKKVVVATWPLGGASDNFPMALDEEHHRLFVGCRSPARLVVLDTTSGKVVATLDLGADVDDVFYDAGRIYASCGEGIVQVIVERDADRYEKLARVATAKGARTSLLVPERHQLFLAVPHRDAQEAGVWIYRVGS